MARSKLHGTLFQTGCGHSWKRRYPKWTIRKLAGASTNCVVYGELLLIEEEQFAQVVGVDRDRFPMLVRAELFHPAVHRKTSGLWPADGAGTFSVSIGEDEEA